MQSLIHGNFEGAAQRKTYALVGASAAIAAASAAARRLVTTYLSWRVGFLLEAVVIAVVLLQVGLLKDVPFTGDRHVDARGSGLSVIGMGGVVLGILVWQEGGDYVVLLMAIGASRCGRWRDGWCGAIARAGRPCSIRTCSGSHTSRSGSPARCCRTSCSAGR